MTVCLCVHMIHIYFKMTTSSSSWLWLHGVVLVLNLLIVALITAAPPVVAVAEEAKSDNRDPIIVDATTVGLEINNNLSRQIRPPTNDDHNANDSLDFDDYKHNNNYGSYWSSNCPSSETFFNNNHNSNSNSNSNNNDVKCGCCCSIRDYGAVGNNSTLNTIAIQSTIDSCHERCTSSSRYTTTTTNNNNNNNNNNNINNFVIIYVPPGNYLTGSILLRSNMRLHLGRGSAIYGSNNPMDYPIVPMLPNGYLTHKRAMWRALISGYDIDNVLITGDNKGYTPGIFANFNHAIRHDDDDINNSDDFSSDDSSLSIIDGVGWKWWCLAKSMPVPQSYCKQMNPNNETIPKDMMRPKLIEFYYSTNIKLDKFTARNSPNWFIHPFQSKNISMTNLTVLAPRSVGNTDGLDPDSCENVLIDSCYIDTGDDGISIKSSNKSSTATLTAADPRHNEETSMMSPTRNITMRNLRIVSRNWCIGSATFGGIYDILFEDSTIGDPYTVTSPWAIKFKSHRYYPGPMENITIRRIVMGKIGPTPWMYPHQPGSVLLLGLSYGNGPPSKGRSGKPIFKNVTFEDITVMSAGVAGKIQGVPEDCLQGLTLRNISVLDGEANWRCNHIDLSTLTISNVYPPVSCSGECTTCNSSTSTSSSNTTVSLVDGTSTATRSG